ncbi:LOW QUALITY PROTEIN: hypothetical protein CFOL_v3_29670, partial [Cephalotus follicularis]
IGDGNTSNTEAFKAAINHLSQFTSDGGSLLYVPAGIWLTGSFNLTSHFTLYMLIVDLMIEFQMQKCRCSRLNNSCASDISRHRWDQPSNDEMGVLDHPDNNYDPNALPVIKNINYCDMITKNVTMAVRLEEIVGDPFTKICISNVTIGLSKKPHKLQWNCTDVAGISSDVTPPCALLPDQGPEK